MDTVKQVHRNKIRQTIPRERLVLAQTPQVFRFDLLQAARSPRRARMGSPAPTNPAWWSAWIKWKSAWLPGSDRNIKITKPSDMDLARLFLAEEMSQPGVK